MIMQEGHLEESMEEHFPETEEFTDCCGSRRRFRLSLLNTDGGYFLRATEIRDGTEGYAFAAHHPASPYQALGQLRQRISRGLATRYLVEQDGALTLGHDRAVGHFSSRSVVIDGVEISMEDFALLLQTYEGFAFDLRIRDPYDEV